MDLNENQNQIPDDEKQAFGKFTREYHQDDVIITEGESNDKFLYLLRLGNVGVYRQVEGKEELITTIEPINFFGEMELIIGGNRLATIKTLSERAVVYAFHNPDLNNITNNPSWREKLLTRLVNDLKDFSDRCIKLEIENASLKQKYEGKIQ